VYQLVSWSVGQLVSWSVGQLVKIKTWAFLIQNSASKIQNFKEARGKCHGTVSEQSFKSFDQNAL
jgi:hypothetical protein